MHQRFHAFDLRVLARLDPPVDVLTLQGTVDTLHADIDMILEARVPESEAPFVEPREDTVMAAIFATSEISPPPPESIPIGVGVEKRMKLEHRRRSAVRWRLQGEPRLLRSRGVR